MFTVYTTKGQVLINKSVEDLINQEEENTTQTGMNDMNRLFTEEKSQMVSKEKGKKAGLHPKGQIKTKSQFFSIKLAKVKMFDTQHL